MNFNISLSIAMESAFVIFIGNVLYTNLEVITSFTIVSSFI